MLTQNHQPMQVVWHYDEAKCPGVAAFIEFPQQIDDGAAGGKVKKPWCAISCRGGDVIGLPR